MKKLYILPIIFFLSIPLLNAQMYPDRHNTNWFDGWVSCTSSISPNAARGNIHWVMYDLGFDYPLGEINMWNCNIPDSTNMGLQNIVIDYSKDGSEWVELGDYTLSQSAGSSIYQGEVVGDFGGQTARYILINAMTNYGGTCYSFSEFRVNIAEIAVPVQLISFDAECTENFHASLQWTTTNEVNNDYFLIQKSKNGVDWEKVGTVKAASIAQEINHYDYTDPSQEEGNHFYRLVQYDLDGNRTEYQMASVICDRVISDIALYPNPADSKIQFFVKTKNTELLTVKLINSIGKEIRELGISTNSPVDVEISDLPNGQYYLQVDLYGKVYKERFVKI